MEIIPGVHQVNGVNGCVYILVREELTLVDTGLPHNTRKIVQYIEDTLGRRSTEITTIVLTHYHVDHIGNAGELKALSGARVAIHEKDAGFLAGNLLRPVPKDLQALAVKALGAFERPPPFEPDIRLTGGDTIAGLACIHTPGHTPGSICLLDSEKRVLFSGDLLRYTGAAIEGPPPLFTPDMDQARRSIRTIATLDFTILLSGHGVPLTAGAAEKVREFIRSFP
jgi:glyoxylase-like metal-dependent hydrolase (beta-lactamase superfamily II)